MSLIQIGKGHVYHSRKDKGATAFHYPTFHLYFRCDQHLKLKEDLRRRFKNFLSFCGGDYLSGDAGSLDENVKKFLLQNCSFEAQDVWLHTMPRMFGFAFNPVSFWFCHRDNKLEAVLVEVNNTFGQRHFYWIYPKTEITDQVWFKAEKIFHVSPFLPVEGFYQFRFQINDVRTRIDINYHYPDGELRLATWVNGQLSAFEKENLISIFGRYGWMTPLVVFRIHYQAAKLWFKIFKFYRKPALPRQEVSS